MEKIYESKMTSHFSGNNPVSFSSQDDRMFYKELAEISGLENDNNWSIYDEDLDQGLFLLHSRIEPKITGLPRGVVVDVENKVVVCDSFGFTPIVSLDNLKTLPNSEDISVVDEFINRHLFESGKYSITPAYEGVVIRAFKHNGKVYFSSHKKLNCSRSRWGNSDYFSDIYKNLKGPSSGELFPEDVLTSPWCYNFLLVDKELQYATKQKIGKGFVVDLGVKRMWNYGDGCPYKDYGSRHDVPYTCVHDISGVVYFEGKESSLLVKPKKLSLEEANTFLKRGYVTGNSKVDLEDSGLEDSESRNLGEAVILYSYDENGNCVDSVRVQSTPYNKRCKIRGDNPNIRHRFYQLINDALRYEDRENLLKKYTNFNSNPGKVDFISVNHDNHYVKLNMKNLDNRIFLIYVHFYDTLPYSQQTRGRELWDEFKKDRRDVIEWFQYLSEKSNPERYIQEEYNDSELKLSTRAVAILDMTKKHALKRVSTGKDKNRFGKRMSQDELVRANIYNLLRRENGPSLFKLIREMKRLQKIKDSMQ